MAGTTGVFDMDVAAKVRWVDEETGLEEGPLLLPEREALDGGTCAIEGS